MDPIPLPAPYGGVDQQVPVQALVSPYCQDLLNFNVNQAGIFLRKGDSLYAPIPLGKYAYQVVKFGETKLFAIQRNFSTSHLEMYDVDLGSVAYTTAASPANAVPFYTMFFGKHLFLFSADTGDSIAPGYVYDGSTWGVIGYVSDGAAGAPTFLPTGGTAGGNRAYIIQSGAAGYWYSDLQAIQGGCHYIDLSYYVSESCYLCAIMPLPFAAQGDIANSTPYMAFMMSNGEILFYSGSYPDSSDWSFQGRAKIGQPFDYNGWIPHQGDVLALVDTGVVSMKDLFLKGSEDALMLTVNANINTKWQTQIHAMRMYCSQPNGVINNLFFSVARACVDTASNRIIISFPFSVDINGNVVVGSFYFVFNTILQSWHFHQSAGAYSIQDIVRYKNLILLLGIPADPSTHKSIVYQKEGGPGFADMSTDGVSDSVGFLFDIISAPISGTGSLTTGTISKDRQYYTQNPSGTAFGKTLVNIDLIMNSDLYSVANIIAIADFGVRQTSPQKLPDVTGLQKANANIGIDGTYIQYGISGTTISGKSVGLNLYGANVWFELQGTPR